MGNDLPVFALVSDALVPRNDCRWPRSRSPFLLDHPVSVQPQAHEKVADVAVTVAGLPWPGEHTGSPSGWDCQSQKTVLAL